MASIVIVVTGGIVRATGSGLGCPNWPMCTDATLAPTMAMGLHGAIEFSNRLLTGVLCVIVGWLIIAARLQGTPSPSVLRCSWAQFWVVVLNAVVGGVTVWMRLSPYIVAAHFLAAMLLLTTAVITWDRARRPQFPAEETAQLPRRCRTAAAWLLPVTALLVVLGTVVTGTGPHAGDSSDVARMPFDWVLVTAIHGALAAATLVLTALMLAALPKGHPGPTRRRTALLLAAIVSQGLVGLLQSLTGLPSLAVVLHLLGAALVWAGAVQVFLSARVPGAKTPSLRARADVGLRAGRVTSSS
ncbi:COX15/CtaA family protein [Streptomyces sp. NPDC020096]